MKKILPVLLFIFALVGVSLWSSGQAGANELNDRLVQAAAAGDTGAVEQLLQQGADINGQGRLGDTPLMMAVRSNNIEMMKLLLGKGADPNAAEEAALFMAIDGGSLEIVKLLLDSGAKTDVAGYHGATPLTEAVERNQTAMMKLLLDKGANPNTQNKNHYSALFLAAVQGDPEVVRLLLDRGADINETNVVQHTALHEASLNGRVTTIKLLIERGANIEARAESDRTPLHLAADWCQLEAARELLDRGANLESLSDRAETPLHLAALRGCTPLVKLLLDRGADLEARNMDGMTPLMFAAESGADARLGREGTDAEVNPAPGVINLLLDRGANIEARSNWGQTALHRAAFSHWPDSVTALLQRGANIQAIDNHGETPLFLANEAFRGFESHVQEYMRIDPSGRNQRSAGRILAAYKEVIRVLEAALPQHPPQSFAEYVSDMQNHPLDRARRQNVVRLAAALTVLPPVPEQASVLCEKGTALMERASDAKERQLAVNVLRGASVVAPWWRDVYLQLSRALELDSQYEFAIRDLEFYLQLHPPEAEARTARTHLRELETREATAAPQ